MIFSAASIHGVPVSLKTHTARTHLQLIMPSRVGSLQREAIFPRSVRVRWGEHFHAFADFICDGTSTTAPERKPTMINGRVDSGETRALRLTEIGIQDSDWIAPAPSRAEPIVRKTAKRPIRMLLVRIEQRILRLCGWVDCPRCNEFVRPRYISDTFRWRCEECDHLNW